MKHPIEKKKEPDEYAGKVNEENKSTRVKRKPAETKKQQYGSSKEAEKESNKSISRWDTDGGVDLCP